MKTDYENTQRANEWAHKHRWYVWLFWPVLALLTFIYVFRNELVFFYYTRIF